MAGRLHWGIVPGSGKSRQASLILTEHYQHFPEFPGGKVLVSQVVRHVERQSPILEVVRDGVLSIATRSLARGDQPCFFIDAASGMGAGLTKILNDLRSEGKFSMLLHKPHPYKHRGVARQGLVDEIVGTYGNGRLLFASGLPLRAELIRALETYQSVVGDDGRVSFEGDEEMVIALGLSLAYSTHGRKMRYLQRNGTMVDSRELSTDPY